LPACKSLYDVGEILILLRTKRKYEEGIKGAVRVNVSCFPFATYLVFCLFCPLTELSKFRPHHTRSLFSSPFTKNQYDPV
jgi:hypothetical protein